ncbi:cutinase family protein [Williamsia sp. D3]|uniref:cutinase family protein n=1 Tax=Williamsia sp. D3 TaxID=1313067 RepID=UPI000407A20F|nr:cutinase family protein [Williamsia sp. D3]
MPAFCCRSTASRLTVLLATFLTVATVTVATAAGPAAAAPSTPGGCPTLYVLGVQGTGESSEDAPVDTDGGMLGSVMRPLLALAGSKVARAYVPYPAGFGGAVEGGKQPYAASVTTAMDRLSSMITQIADKCEDTDFAFAGYSQGAHAAANVAKQIGAGNGPIEADRVAGVALFGNPARPTNAPLFPGASDQTAPEPAPGSSGESLAQIPAPQQGEVSGGGIGPTADQSSGYGELSGRVMDRCAPGDLACAAPADSPIVHLVANIGGQSELDQADPVGSLTSLGQALALTSIKAGVEVINEDVQGETLADLSYSPTETISQRLATASDPRTPMPTIPEAINAVVKVGTIGFNAVTTVLRTTFTPDTIGALATVGLANPPAALGILAAKLGAAVVDLVPPTTVNRWASEAFDAVKANVKDNEELLDVSTMINYWKTTAAHGSYTNDAATTTGANSTLYVAQWFAALANDLAGDTFTPYNADGLLNYDSASPVSGVPVPSVPSSTPAVSSSESQTNEPSTSSSAPALPTLSRPALTDNGS